MLQPNFRIGLTNIYLLFNFKIHKNQLILFKIHHLMSLFDILTYFTVSKS